MSTADRDRPLDPADLELLATSAYLIRRDDDAISALERAYARFLGAGDPVGAVRCAFWISLGLLNRGEPAGASGWVGRGRRLLGHLEGDCVERGYLLVPDVLVNAHSAGDLDAAFASAGSVAEVGERFGDSDLMAFARHALGRVRIKQGRVAEGMVLLDEAMVAVVGGELSSPLLTGLIYCGVIDACEEVFEVRRAREWTDALSRWCEAQPQMLDFTGLCLVHRAGGLQLRGAWESAIDEARRACERLAPGEAAAGAGRYRQAEIHRLRGEPALAEAAYRDAGDRGWPPQPGLALLWLAQGRTDASVAAIRRVLAETTDRLGRARLLPAYVEIMLAAGDHPAARAGARELCGIAADHDHGVLAAMAARAVGAVELAGGDHRAALIALREAGQRWQAVEAPYEVAQVRALLGLACRGLGDEDSAAWELAAARDAFERLGAVPDAARMAELIDASRGERPWGLTERERQVLRLVAAGRSNRAIAEELVLSERTVDRHVGNILTKLGVPSRTAATAFAYAHKLV